MCCFFLRWLKSEEEYDDWISDDTGVFMISLRSVLGTIFQVGTIFQTSFDSKIPWNAIGTLRFRLFHRSTNLTKSFLK